ncbi:type VII secretion system-associated protein [Streptomyces minutiscleroticus]|nr:type VII secretion system-associated protein [Streptomyces minutiscleroticus]
MRPGEQQEARPGAPVALSDAEQAAAPEAPASGAHEDADSPEIPEAVRAAARRAPGHWIGVVDPEWTEERTPPEWAVLGEWRSDESGGVGTYRANPEYRPSARVLGWPEPTDPVDAAAQRAATGYGTVDEALAALAEAEVTVVRGPAGGPLTAAGRDGAPVVPVFTSPEHEFMSAALHHDTLPARELARSVSGTGTLLLVNAGAAAPLLVPADSLPGPVDGPDGAAEDGAAAEDTASSGAEDRTGPQGGATAADRTGGPTGPRPRTSGRTP